MSEIANGQRTLRLQSRLDELEGKPAVMVEVSDTGVGLSSSDSSRLFEAFHTTKPQGMGMGLWISRSIIESHHGRLTASPNQGPRATFAILLPTVDQEVSGNRGSKTDVPVGVGNGPASSGECSGILNK